MTMNRLSPVFGILCVLLFGTHSLAADPTTAERSPFYQGHWWDPSRSGHGFELFNTNDQVAVVWYTYDAGGRPIWYNAQGSKSALGTQSLPLWQHRWADGRIAETRTVGTIRLTVLSPMSIEVTHDLGGATTTPWKITPFLQSATVNEVDHTGHWFAPANSGWGFTLTEQGDVLGAVLYTYDTAGAPTWLAGFGRGTGNRVDLFRTSGYCPGCPRTTVTNTPAGSLTFDYQSETELVVANALNVAMAPGVQVSGARARQLGRPASTRTADRRLAAFDGQASLKDFLVAGLLLTPQISPVGVDFSASPPPPSTAFSPTNLQEAGVDESGLVKTDGRHVYTFAHDAQGRRQRSLRVAEIDAAGTFRAGAFVSIGGDAGSAMDSAGLILHERQLVSVTGTQASAPCCSVWWNSYQWGLGSTQVEIFDVTQPALPLSRWQARIDGHPIATRRIGDKLYVVTRFFPRLEGFTTPWSPNTAANQALLATTALSKLLPSISVNGAPAVPAVDATSIFVPPLGDQPLTADLVTITAIDLPGRRVAQSLAIAGRVDTVYVSPGNLYIASSRYQYRNSSGSVFAEPSFYTTDVSQVRLSGAAMAVVGTGSLEGYLSFDVDQAPFRLSEHEGHLRAVTSNRVGMWGNGIQNRVTILKPSASAPGLLKTVSAVPNAARPESIGKPFEQLYATRFVGNRLYAVTFRLTDPLYSIELGDPTDPRIGGSLEIPGFSEYLHPLPGGLLLGFGKAADAATGLFQGLQLSLYDVRGAVPRELQRLEIGKRGSESALLSHHHAFSLLPKAHGNLSFAIPARIHDGPPSGSPMSWFPYQRSALLMFELQDSAGAPRIVAKPELAISSSMAMSYQDPTAFNGRSILFDSGPLFIGQGRFWMQDNAGASHGPF